MGLNQVLARMNLEGRHLVMERLQEQADRIVALEAERDTAAAQVVVLSEERDMYEQAADTRLHLLGIAEGNLHRAERERERLQAAGDGLIGYVDHAPSGHACVYGCSCGLREAMLAWEAAKKGEPG